MYVCTFCIIYIHVGIERNCDKIYNTLVSMFDGLWCTSLRDTSSAWVTQVASDEYGETLVRFI
jgi:hypothetical protein